MAKCGMKTEIYSRVCGYFRPVANWNKGKKEELSLCQVVKEPRGHQDNEKVTRAYGHHRNGI